MSEIRRTPAGAELRVTRSRGFGVLVTVDRADMLDATASQCEKVRELALREMSIAGTTNRAAAFLASPSMWVIPTASDRELLVLAELFDIERGEWS
ncbi:hypothetical protein GCM10027568_11060 [Humibacter soli]